MKAILEFSRKMTLFEPCTSDLDMLPMLDPVERVKAVAKAVVNASRMNEMLDDLAREGGILPLLQTEAKARRGGTVIVSPAFEMVLTSRNLSKERASV